VMSRTNNNWHNMTVNETCKTYVFLCYVWRRNAWLFGCCSLASKGALHRCWLTDKAKQPRPGRCLAEPDEMHGTPMGMAVAAVYTLIHTYTHVYMRTLVIC